VLFTIILQEHSYEIAQQ